MKFYNIQCIVRVVGLYCHARCTCMQTDDVESDMIVLRDSNSRRLTHTNKTSYIDTKQAPHHDPVNGLSGEI